MPNFQPQLLKTFHETTSSVTWKSQQESNQSPEKQKLTNRRALKMIKWLKNWPLCKRDPGLPSKFSARQFTCWPFWVIAIEWLKDDEMRLDALTRNGAKIGPVLGPSREKKKSLKMMDEFSNYWRTKERKEEEGSWPAKPLHCLLKRYFSYFLLKTTPSAVHGKSLRISKCNLSAPCTIAQKNVDRHRKTI